MFTAAALVLFSLVLPFAYAEKCPPIFGEVECADGYSCKDNVCVSADGKPPATCANLNCPLGTACIDAKCFPLSVLKCNRHVLTADGQARSIVTDCGKNGRCVNGNCILDRCHSVWCEDGEICREGKCTKLIDTFCLGHADCGPSMQCTANKCALKSIDPICNCQPTEICHHGQCYPNAACTNVFCGDGSYCVEGRCISAVGADCTKDQCRGGTICLNGVCASNPCPSRCPADQNCREGECRVTDGLPCVGQCGGPYDCIDGRCRRNDCKTKVCQLGENCENGQCARVAGRFCTWGPRDCGPLFSCNENRCVELLSLAQAETLGNQLVYQRFRHFD